MTLYFVIYLAYQIIWLLRDEIDLDVVRTYILCASRFYDVPDHFLFLGSCKIEVALDWNNPKLNSLDNFYKYSIWFYQNRWVVEKIQPSRYAFILCP
jgi:hypothetical protein